MKRKHEINWVQDNVTLEICAKVCSQQRRDERGLKGLNDIATHCGRNFQQDFSTSGDVRSNRVLLKKEKNCNGLVS